jgi:hypothetical protein
MLGILADFLERPAGEVVVGFGLIALGSGLYVAKLPKSDDIVVAGLTLISRAMVAKVSASSK